MAESIEADSSTKSITVPRLMIVGTHRGAGASTVMIGLLAAIKGMGTSISVGKIGPSLIETTHQRRIGQRLAHNLDPWMLSREQMLESVARLSTGAEIMLLEGEYGPYDLREEDFSFRTDLEIAAELGAPVILVVDAEGYNESIAAAVQGFLHRDIDHQIVGIIANRVRDKGHLQRIKRAIESVERATFLGGVMFVDETNEADGATRRDALNPSLLPRSRLVNLGKMVQLGVNIALVRELAENAGMITVPERVVAGATRLARIAVADDAAFHLTIQDNLDLLRRAGGDLVAFSPLADLKLPSKAAAVYLPGGYLHLYAADLQLNKSMLMALNEFAAAGGIIYAEGAALPYLCRKVVISSGESFEMVGIVNATATSLIDDTTPSKLVYCEVNTAEDTVIAQFGDRFRGFVDTRWVVQVDEEIPKCFHILDRMSLGKKSQGGSLSLLGGISPYPNVIASTVHAHWGSNSKMATLFMAHAALRSPAPVEPPTREETTNPGQ